MPSTDISAEQFSKEFIDSCNFDGEKSHLKIAACHALESSLNMVETAQGDASHLISYLTNLDKRIKASNEYVVAICVEIYQQIILLVELKPRYEANANYSLDGLPPPETVELLRVHDVDPFSFKWRNVPIIEDKTETDHSTKTVEADALMEPLLATEKCRKALQGTLRVMDTANGCRNQCDTCLNDAQPLTSIFDTDSLDRLFADERFLRTLHPASLRLGSSGDIINHPDSEKILRMILERTRQMPHHTVKVLTNFASGKEDQLDEIISIAKKDPRLILTVSIPVNRNPAVKNRFIEYSRARGINLFDPKKEFADHEGKNVRYFPVILSKEISRMGRIISNISEVLPPERITDATRKLDFYMRGWVKTVLNPDALWLQVYATAHESHTGKVYTPITPENLPIFRELPWNLYFPDDPKKMRKPAKNWRHCNLSFHEKGPIGQAVAKALDIPTKGLNKR